MLYPRNVKQLIDGSVGQLRAELCVRLDGVQDLVFVLGSTDLKQARAEPELNHQMLDNSHTPNMFRFFSECNGTSIHVGVRVAGTSHV